MFKVSVKGTKTQKCAIIAWGKKSDCIAFASKLSQVTENEYIKVIREKDNKVVFEIVNEPTKTSDTMEKWNDYGINFDKVTEIIGHNSSCGEVISIDEIEVKGICQYNKYTLIYEDGTENEYTKEDMQKDVNKW